MPWIESHQSLGHHRKTLAAVSLLRVDRHKLIGHLQELWWWGLDNADSDGLVGHVPCEALAVAAGWPLRDAERFVQAIKEVGFLDEKDEGYVLHDWYDYAGKLNDQRALRKASNRAAQQRRRQRSVSADKADSQHPTGPDQPDQPPVGPVTRTLPARARGGPDEPTARGAPTPVPLSNGARQCPLCPEIFTGSYDEHLANSPRHKIRSQPEDFSGRRSSSNGPSPAVTEAEIAAELEAVGQRQPLSAADLSDKLRAEHEELQARERQRAKRSNGQPVSQEMPEQPSEPMTA